MKYYLQNSMLSFALFLLISCFFSQILAQSVPSDLMDNCNQWKITYPTGVEDKTLCGEANNEFFYLNDTKDAIVFKAPIRTDNGTTPNSSNIRSELRERLADGSADIYWTTEGSHIVYVKQAITHLPINKSQLVATQIHGNKDDGIDDAMVMRLENSHLFLSFNGGKLRSNVTVKTNYTLGTIHEVIFLVVDGKHYCYYSEDGNLLNAYNSGNASTYLVKSDGNDFVMDLNYDESYFKVGNYTQSNADEEGNDTDDLTNYGEVLVYDFFVKHDDVTVTGVNITPSSKDIYVGNTYQLSASVSPTSATNNGLNYSSSNSAIASVDSNGLVTALSEGSAIITVTSDEGGYKDTCDINVVEVAIIPNLALNKSITGTGTEDGTNVVTNLVDGLTTTRWSVSGYPQTAIVDLGEIYNLQRTELVAYSDRDYKYIIAIASSESGPYTQIVDRSANDSPATITNPNINLFDTIAGRFVKITVTSSKSYTGTWISLIEFRVFGTSISVDENDIDGDGILNENDKCSNTKAGASVDANGCELLDSTNFTITAISETCSDKNNGQLVITANKSKNYTLTFNEETYSFTTEKTLNNITPGAYEFCIEVVGVTSAYCYSVEITEGTKISGKSSLQNKQLYLTIFEGTLPYRVYVDGDLQFETSEKDFNFEVNHGDVITIKTDIDCEGIYSEKIELIENITVYPNPSNGLFSIPIATNAKSVKINVLNSLSQLISSKTYNLINSKVLLDLTNENNGIYLVKVFLDKEYQFKIVKN